MSCSFLVAEPWLRQIYCDLQVQGGHVLIYWWHFPASRVTWNLWSADKVKGLCCVRHSGISKRTEDDGEGFFLEATGVFLLQLSNNKHFFYVTLNLTGEALKPRLPSSRRHWFRTKTAAGVTGKKKKKCPQTQMILNDYADYDLGAASFVSNCSLLCGRGPCVV